MNKNTSDRAYRREQRKKHINRIFRRKLDTGYFGSDHSDERQKEALRNARKEVHAKQKCSNPLCCGNPRHQRMTNKPTLQERKNEEVYTLVSESA